MSGMVYRKVPVFAVSILALCFTGNTADFHGLCRNCRSCRMAPAMQIPGVRCGFHCYGCFTFMVTMFSKLLPHNIRHHAFGASSSHRLPLRHDQAPPFQKWSMPCHSPPLRKRMWSRLKNQFIYFPDSSGFLRCKTGTGIISVYTVNIKISTLFCHKLLFLSLYSASTDICMHIFIHIPHFRFILQTPQHFHAEDPGQATSHWEAIPMNPALELPDQLSFHVVPASSPYSFHPGCPSAFVCRQWPGFRPIYADSHFSRLPWLLQPTLFPCLSTADTVREHSRGQGSILVDGGYKRAAERIITGLPLYAGRAEMTGMGILPGGKIPGAVLAASSHSSPCQPVSFVDAQQRNPGFFINRENIQRAPAVVKPWVFNSSRYILVPLWLL